MTKLHDLTNRAATEEHDIARQAKLNVMARHPLLYLMTHFDPVIPGARCDDGDAGPKRRDCGRQ
jgi:hypothetical protein